MTKRHFVSAALILALVACDFVGPGSGGSSPPTDAPPIAACSK